MELTEQQKSEVMPVYETWWKSYLNGDVKTYDYFLDDDYRFVGSTEAEAFLDRKDTTKFFEATADQLAGKSELRNSILKAEFFDGLIFITELADAYLLYGDEWTFYGKFRFSSVLKKNIDGWRFIYQHFSTPDSKAQEGETIGTEQIAAENLQLRDAIKRRTVELENKSRELEIEASLERVRSSALAMTEPADMVEVCRIISDQLQILGVNDIRNIQTAIIDEEKSFYLNYQYFTAYARSAIELAEYNKHPKAREMAETMKRSANAFFNQSFDGEELNVFREYRKQDNQFPDPILEASSSLHFYFYSIGPGALGISTYNSTLSDSDTSLFKRFRNVFELAYRRFLDIQKAEAQAREAQIELALETVRARTMAMQKSDELKEVIQVVYEQFVRLNIHTEHTGFIMDYQPRNDMHIWLADKHEVPSQITIPYFDSPHWNRFIEAKEKGIDFFANHLTFEEKNKFYHDLFKLIPGVPEETSEYYFSCPGLAISTVLLENVGLYIENFSGIPYTDEENNTLMRFGKVFQQTYTRFLDLQKAEAQAREAEIELSLERVRSKAMAMHSPNDLSETVNVFFKELKTLGIIPIRCGVGQIDEATRTTSLTTTTSSQQGESFRVIGKVKQTGHPVLDGIFNHWKLQKEYHPVLQGEDIKAYYNVMNAQIGYPEYPEEVTQYGNNFFFKEGFVFAWTENLLSEKELIIFRRFTLVLSLTYRRYLDLKEAEERNKIIQAENDRKTKELEEARQLQLSMLPKKLPQLSHLDIAVHMKTATEVGGDYYDFNIDINGTLTVVLGDATGHGMMSGMMVSIMKSFFISNKAHIELKQFFENANNSIKDMHLGRLMMSFMGVQIASHKMIATNAGMPSLIYFRNKSQKAGEFVSNNLPLGAMKGTKYSLKEIVYEKGDTLLLMSDGFAELKNKYNEQYGYPRIIEEFRSVAHKNSDAIVEHLNNSASEWIKGIEPDDDVTFIVIKVK